MTNSGEQRTADAGVMDGDGTPNGAAWAALLAGGIGAFAVGFVVLLNEAGLFVAPALYVPAGGVSGRTTIAVATWLIAWTVTHRLLRDRSVDPGRISVITLILVALGFLGTFPPVWRVF